MHCQTFENVILTSQKTSSWNTPIGISPTYNSQSTQCTIALFSDSEQMEYFVQTNNKKTAKKNAAELSNQLGVPLELLQ